MPNSPRQRFFSVTAWVVAVPLFFWVVYVGLTAGLQEAPQDVEGKYTTVLVTRHNLTREVIGTGAITPVEEYVAQSEIFGVVARVHVDDGDRVAQGDLIAEIDRTAIAQQVAELKAELDHAEANARFALVAQAEVRLTQAAQEFARAQDLNREGLLADEPFEKARSTLELAQLAVGDAKSEAAARQAAIAIARAKLTRAQTDLEKTNIRAPIDGIVVRRLVNVGQTVVGLLEGGTRIATLVNDRSVHAVVQVDENDIAEVKVGQPVKVAIDAFPGENFSGTVRKIAWAGTADKSVASFASEIELQPDPRFRVKMSVDVRIIIDAHQDVLAIPNAAIFRDREGVWVKRVHGQEVSRVAVSLGWSDGFHTIVTEGVQAGDRLRVLTDRLPDRQD